MRAPRIVSTKNTRKISCMLVRNPGDISGVIEVLPSMNEKTIMTIPIESIIPVLRIVARNEDAIPY